MPSTKPNKNTVFTPFTHFLCAKTAMFAKAQGKLPVERVMGVAAHLANIVMAEAKPWSACPNTMHKDNISAPKPTANRVFIVKMAFTLAPLVQATDTALVPIVKGMAFSPSHAN